MFSYYTNAITKHYVDFRGRARRSEFWYFALFNFIVAAILGTIDQAAHTGQALAGIYNLIVFLPSFALSVRRLHDLNRSGWWLLLALIPIVGWIILLWWDCTEGTHGPNEHGPDPKAMPTPAAAVA